jgi:hypothetical protein
MNKILIASLALALAGCSTTSQTNFENGIATFNKDVALVDSAVANLSALLYKNCMGIQTTAQAIASLSSGTSTAAQAVVGANAAINSYCQAPQVTNVPSAIKASADAYNATKSALAAVKAGN